MKNTGSTGSTKDVNISRKYLCDKKAQGYKFERHGSQYRCARRSKPYNCKKHFICYNGVLSVVNKHSLACKRAAAKLVAAPKEDEDLAEGEKDIIQMDIPDTQYEQVSDATQALAAMTIDLKQNSQVESSYRCLVCLEDDETLRRTSCCGQLLHKECYERSVQSKLDLSRPKRSISELSNDSKEEKQLKKRMRQEIAKLCPHCKKAVPMLNSLGKAEIGELRRIPLYQTNFLKAKNVIQKQVAELTELVYQQKLTLSSIEDQQQNREVSHLQLSLHPSEVNSNEVSKAFSDIINLAGLDIKDLTEAQNYELKMLRASDNALKEKLLQQQVQFINMKTQYQLDIDELSGRLYQQELENEAELQEKLQTESMKELTRANQIKVAVDAIIQYKNKLLTTEDWLRSLSYCKSDDNFQKVGAPICDAIVLPKCSLLFPKEPFKSMKTFLIEMGIPVNTVYHAVKAGFVFVQLKESRNAFTYELVAKLRKSISVLTLRTYVVSIKQGCDNQTTLKELQNMYVRQIDFTQDLSGFFMFLGNLFEFLREFGKLIGMNFAKEYNQLLTCIQFITFNNMNQPTKRLKIYNKFVHLLTSGQFKKKINMALQKLLYPSMAFLQDKLLPTIEEGLTRIELSDYFNSWKDYQESFGTMDSYHMQIDCVLNALNKMRDMLYYKVPLQLMLNSYFTFCQTQIVAFDQNIQVICYSYNQRSHTFVGVINNRTRHSPSSLLFLKNYLTLDSSAIVFLQGKHLGDVFKNGDKMQLPICSLNEKHHKKDVQIESEQLCFELRQSNKIEISTGSQAVANFLGIQCQQLGFQGNESMQCVSDVDKIFENYNVTNSEQEILQHEQAVIVPQSISTFSPNNTGLENLRIKNQQLKRESDILCTCSQVPCLANPEIIHSGKCEWWQAQKSTTMEKTKKRELKDLHKQNLQMIQMNQRWVAHGTGGKSKKQAWRCFLCKKVTINKDKHEKECS